MNHNLQLVYHLPPHCSSWCSMSTDQAGKAQKSLKITPNTRTDYQSLPKLMLTLSSAPLYEWPWGSDTVNSQTQTPFCCCHHIGCWTTNLRHTRSHKKSYFRIMWVLQGYDVCRILPSISHIILASIISKHSDFTLLWTEGLYWIITVKELTIHFTELSIQLNNTFIHLSK